MNGLHWTAQILLAAVFLFAGFGEIFSFRRRAAALPGGVTLGFDGLPYELALVIGVAEIVGALALVVPVDLWPPDILPRLAAATLGLLPWLAALITSGGGSRLLPMWLCFCWRCL